MGHIQTEWLSRLHLKSHSSQPIYTFVMHSKCMGYFKVKMPKSTFMWDVILWYVLSLQIKRRGTTFLLYEYRITAYIYRVLADI